MCARFIVITAPGDSRLGSDTHVLGNEVLGSEIVHEIFSCDEASVLIILFHNDLLELSADDLHNFFEFEGHRLVLERTDVLIELLVKLLDDATAPGLNLIVHKLHLLGDLFCTVSASAVIDKFLL